MDNRQLILLKADINAQLQLIKAIDDKVLLEPKVLIPMMSFA